ncbi:hypothetical protein [Thalassomonas sp. RHCl1]|uniref:hypothetical protein n=1 Tax=Thalassomonas sp. RHCl1 TaxID=2995320 RepID=UPI00248B4DA9|nr:hypothetical protein [Thalassomonas sp. RHCl1]
MKYIKIIFTLACLLSLFSCSITKADRNNNALLDFAKSNCFFWYFKSQNYDTEEIGKITSGIVEMSSYSAEKFQKVALLVKEYAPNVHTKQNVDIQLAKCFILESDKAFIAELHAIREL